MFSSQESAAQLFVWYLACHVAEYDTRGRIVLCFFRCGILSFVIFFRSLFAYNSLSGTLPDMFGGWNSLSNLWDLFMFTLSLSSWFSFSPRGLSFNQLIGTLPSSLGNCTKLSTLYVFWRTLSQGSLFSFLPSLPQIHHGQSCERNYPLWIGVTVAATNSVGNYFYRREIFWTFFLRALSTNSLSGTIPQALGRLSKLNALYSHSFCFSLNLNTSSFVFWFRLLHSNDLSGTIPEALGNMTHLNFL